MVWSSVQYRRFEAERTRPVRDLVAAIPRGEAAMAVDLGCGPGNSTEVLASRYPGAAVAGLDSSEDMIRAARERLPDISFSVSDIASFRPRAPVDILLANASLQWLPEHQALYPYLLSQLSEGGCLAVQTPDNLQEPAHTVARELAAGPRWAERLGQVRHPDRHQAAWYYELLKPHCTELDVWRTIYMHPLENSQAVVEWFKGSALRPFIGELNEGEKEEFLAGYLEGVSAAYPPLADGTVLLPFPRLFIVATR